MFHGASFWSVSFSSADARRFAFARDNFRALRLALSLNTTPMDTPKQLANSADTPTKRMTPETIESLSAGFSTASAYIGAALAITGFLAWRCTDIDSENKKKELSEYKRKSEADSQAAAVEIEHAKTDAAKAIKETAEARLEQERIKALVAWRTIDPEIAERVSSALRGDPGSVFLELVSNDPECTYLAFQIRNLFENAGWRIRVKSTQFSGSVIWGVFVFENPTNKALSARVRSALKIGFPDISSERPVSMAAGMSLSMGSEPENDAIQVLVASKKPPF